MLCFCCGICCRKYQVCVSLVEARRISDHLGLNWQEFIDKYVDQYWPGAETLLLRRKNGKCVFLNQIEGGKICRCCIHSVEPSNCMEWNFSLFRADCQEGLAKYWGLTANLSGDIQGPEQNIQEFKKFMDGIESGNNNKLLL